MYDVTFSLFRGALSPSSPVGPVCHVEKNNQKPRGSGVECSRIGGNDYDEEDDDDEPQTIAELSCCGFMQVSHTISWNQQDRSGTDLLTLCLLCR
jgi:hypothetical protein